MKNNKNINVEALPLPLKFDVNTMTMFCAYTVNMDSELVSKNNLESMRHLFDRLDDNIYQYDDQLAIRKEFILKALDCRLNMKINNRDVVLNHCRNECSDVDSVEQIIEIMDSRYRLTDKDVQSINTLIKGKTKIGFIHGVRPLFEEYFEDLALGKFHSDDEVLTTFNTLMHSTTGELRKVSSVESNNVFNLSDKFSNVVTKTVEDYRKPSFRLRTSIQMHNDILGGGYEKTRVYMYLGLTGGFKSGILLTIAKDLKRYNKGYKTKDPEKRPVILFITQENSIAETIQRMFNMTVTTNPLHEYTPDEVEQLLKVKGEFTVTEEDNIDIEFRYYGHDAIDTSEIYSINNTLNEEGKEVIAIIHDYIGRIRPANKHMKETREVLGAVANEFKNIAQELDVPVITASQLNRDGARAIDSAAGSNKEDLARILGRSNIGESWSMLQNIDWSCIIHREFSSLYKRLFLAFSLIKIRYSNGTDLSYFAQPFDEENTMQILEDLDEVEPLGKLSLSGDITAMNNNNNSFAERPSLDDLNDSSGGKDESLAEFDGYMSTINKKKNMD